MAARKRKDCQKNFHSSYSYLFDGTNLDFRSLIAVKIMFKLIVSMIAVSQEILSKTLVGTSGKPGTFITFFRHG